MMSESVLWGERIAAGIARAKVENALVILSLRCLEQHAVHLPVDTDTWQVEQLTREGVAVGGGKGTICHGLR